jgi:peroxiredoxin
MIAVRLALLLAWLAGSSLARADDAPACRTPAVGQPAPKFAVLQGDGQIGVSLPAALRKHLPVVVNFWRHDCEPCKKELPDFQKVATELQGKVTFLLVHVGDDEAKMRQVLQRLHVTLPSAADLNQTVAQDYCVATAIPRTFIIDASGKVQAMLATVDAEGLRQALSKVTAAHSP